MKNVLRKFFILTIVLLGKLDVFAKPNPPVPASKTAAGPIVPPGLPIDGNILFLLIFGVLLGIYIVHKYQYKIKAPI